MWFYFEMLLLPGFEFLVVYFVCGHITHHAHNDMISVSCVIFVIFGRPGNTKAVVQSVSYCQDMKCMVLGHILPLDNWCYN